MTNRYLAQFLANKFLAGNITLVTALLFLSHLAAGQNLDSGMVANYRFNNSIINLINSESGTVTGNIIYGPDRFGNDSSAVYFDGTSHIVINSTNLDITEGTIAFWGLSYASGGNTRDWVYFDSNPTGDASDQRILLWKGGLSGSTGTSLIGGIDYWKDVDHDVSDWNTSDWNHISMTWRAKNDGSDFVKLFINGIKVSELVNTSKDMQSLASTIILGKHFTSNSSFYIGYMDDFKIYDRALTETEIDSLQGVTESINTGEPIVSNGITCTSIFCDGDNVGIGTEHTHGFKLAVAGNIITEKVKVSVVENWPDYVFKSEYKLPTLEEVEKHISHNGNLKGIPNAASVESNGFYLGEMDGKLLQKIEELTLYMIEQNRENKRQKRLIEKLEAEVAILKSKIGN